MKPLALARYTGGMRWPRLLLLVAGLLLVEVAGLALVQLVVVWSAAPDLHRALRSPTDLGITVVMLGLAPAAALALAAAVAVLAVPRRSWLLTMLAQVVTLGACLLLHVELGAQRPGALAPLMAYAVLLVPYLNSDVVRTAMLPVGRDC
jgi:hypothetical protein